MGRPVCVPAIDGVMLLALVAGMVLAAAPWAWAVPEGQLFYVSFDRLTTTADFSVGEGRSTFTADLELRSAEGIRGAGLLQQRGERCSYPVVGNLDTSQGTCSLWVKPLSWDGHSGKFRHFLTADCGVPYQMYLYLFPIGDEAVTSFIQANARTAEEAISRARAGRPHRGGRPGY
jgi:hypothetical protein